MQGQIDIILEAIVSMQEYQTASSVKLEATLRHLIVELIDEKLNLDQNARRCAEANGLAGSTDGMAKLMSELDASKQRISKLMAEAEANAVQYSAAEQTAKRVEELKGRNVMVVKELEDVKSVLSDTTGKYEEANVLAKELQEKLDDTALKLSRVESSNKRNLDRIVQLEASLKEEVSKHAKTTKNLEDFASREKNRAGALSTASVQTSGICDDKGIQTDFFVPVRKIQSISTSSHVQILSIYCYC
jgi:chromosome segregation ATPase